MTRGVSSVKLCLATTRPYGKFVKALQENSHVDASAKVTKEKHYIGKSECVKVQNKQISMKGIQLARQVGKVEQVETKHSGFIFLKSAFEAKISSNDIYGLEI